MASKYKVQSSDVYINDTDVPINKLNIDDSVEIHELEKELITEAYKIFYDELNENTLFNETYFIELHRRTFEALYAWAGIYRDLNMAKGESRFCQGMYVQSESKKIFEALKKDNYLKDYENKPKEEFAKKLAYYKCELIALHPFYELNGRITRLFFDMIALFNGYKYIDYSTITPKEYIDAAIECVQFADSDNMEKIILDGLKK
ncbi:MAG: cell filamentation protein Fic [Epsilonproteobacteria bacterium]|nr:cell filamentation protein Fic [Campylobacterota bacterium]OIO16790.1 MAG: cell filamentation protein Fic [Helicobacteraceae bacterium CG1_02_36_14]PIP10055.1 MAG: cell filamentation protein Fic [Sulfurimonas sp. CG23_combo_of_CG06-09_8_20_14_all_36_33]PIS23651.1 MAG: cell filamentation protein Fic [Sulfurimonas sp. CG08_land_8_20_14_0_20_36_33]PIU34846.1 MAG: cell filamentation protein Fic [Sulfurimonas sp. CG07_land_8_20_14_0_80_36_56]PIV05106.1 MAG: cell filamentation protein Fic [Sulfur